MITPAESKAARRLLGWTQESVAARMLISSHALGKFESRERMSPMLNLTKLENLYADAGVEFSERGVRMRIAP